MPALAIANSDVSHITLRWQRIVELAALISLFWAPAVVFGLGWGWMGLVMGSPFWLPYLFILVRLQGKATQSGLALAVAMGCVMFFPAGTLVSVAREWDRSWWIQASLALAALAQPLMAAAAVRTYYTMPRERRDRRKLLWSGAYGWGLFFWFASTLPDVLPSRIGSDQARAAALLRSINTAASSYATQFEGMYPVSFVALESPAPGEKPDCKASNLLGPPPDSRTSGYVFEYRAGDLTDHPVGGCVGAKSYTVTARPNRFGHSGRSSFFTEQSGVIRATTENRAATITDPPLE